MKRILLAFIGPATLCSCVGLSIEYDYIGKNQYIAPSTTRLRVANVAASSAPPVITKQMVLDAWGKPDRSTKSDGLEKWIYNDEGLVWNGVWIAVLIPIPLAVPVGHNYVAIEFKEDVVANIETRSQGATGFLCPTLKNVHTLELGCDTDNSPSTGDIPKRFYGRKPLTGGIKTEVPKIPPKEEKQEPEKLKWKPVEDGTMGFLFLVPPNNRFQPTSALTRRRG